MTRSLLMVSRMQFMFLHVILLTPVHHRLSSPPLFLLRSDIIAPGTTSWPIVRIIWRAIGYLQGGRRTQGGNGTCPP
jgi:hypothetical protein